MSDIRTVSNDSGKVISNASVAAGGSTSSSEERLDTTKNNITAGFSLSGAGSPKVTLEVYFGDDSNGNPIWITADSSTKSEGVLKFDGDAGKARVTVTETGGASGLSDIYAWISGRPV